MCDCIYHSANEEKKNRICSCEGTSDGQNKTILYFYFFYLL